MSETEILENFANELKGLHAQDIYELQLEVSKKFSSLITEQKAAKQVVENEKAVVDHRSSTNPEVQKITARVQFFKDKLEEVSNEYEDQKNSSEESEKTALESQEENALEQRKQEFNDAMALLKKEYERDVKAIQEKFATKIQNIPVVVEKRLTNLRRSLTCAKTNLEKEEQKLDVLKQQQDESQDKFKSRPAIIAQKKLVDIEKEMTIVRKKLCMLANAQSSSSVRGVNEPLTE